MRRFRTTRRTSTTARAQTEDTIHLEPGTHTLQLDFGDGRHMQFDPPIVSKKITIHVK